MANDKGRLTRVFGVNDYASSSDYGAEGLESCAYEDGPLMCKLIKAGSTQ